MAGQKIKNTASKGPAGSHNNADGSAPGVERIFLPWSEPFLPQAAAFLLENLSVSGSLPAFDLSGAIVVFPGEHAAIRMAELLTHAAAERGRGLIPPTIITIGALPELLLPAGWAPAGAARPAGRLERRLLWRAVLKETGPVLMPEKPADNSEGQWLRLAEMFDGLMETLGAEGLSIEEVAGLLTEDDSPDAARWSELAKAARRYAGLLEKGRLYDRNVGRLTALRAGLAGSNRSVVLAGCSDMNRVTQSFVEAAAQTGRVIALVHATEDQADDFDPQGTIKVARWAERSAEIAEKEISPEKSPVDQAQAVAAMLALSGISSKNPSAASRATIAVCDDSLMPFVRESLAETGVPSYFIGGITAASTPPFRLLESAARAIRSKTFADLSALLRHPDMLRYLIALHPDAELPGSADLLFENHLPAGLDGDLMPRLAAQARTCSGAAALEGRAAAALMSLNRLVAPLDCVAAPAQAASVLRNFFSEIYGQTSRSGPDLYERRVLPLLGRAIAELESAELQDKLPVHGSIDLLLDLAAADKFQIDAPEHAALITGWLDLAHDDAPLAIACGFNDSAVPAPLPANPFLPASLRSRLGIEDDRRRLARDSYLLATIVASKELRCFILGKESHDQSSLLPSRLLLRCRGETLAKRLLRLTKPPKEGLTAAPSKEEKSAWLPAPPPPLPSPIESIRVTGFKTYLTCPYLFYLQHVLGLESHDDSALELNPRQFGTLIHDVLAQFGADSAIRDSSDEREIAKYLSAAADRLFARDFGPASHPAVRLQFRNAEKRLHSFAAAQAARRRDGWVIELVEKEFTLELQPADKHVAALVQSYRLPVKVRGRIDRIDRHERTDRLAIFDYKTGDSAAAPAGAHYKGGAWIDLQLPLYRAHADQAYPEAAVELGYICLPAAADETSFAVAEWSEDELGDAYARAADIAGLIRAEKFWPPVQKGRLGEENEFAKLYGRERFEEIEARSPGPEFSVEDEAEAGA